MSLLILPLFAFLCLTDSSPFLFSRLMPYPAYPMHWPLVHLTQRDFAGTPRLVDGFNCQTSGNFPSEDCSSYFTCVEEPSGLKAYTVSCPAGLHYNPSIEKCDWPENAQCASQQNGDGDAPQVAPILVEVVEDFDCATEGVFQDPDDCSRYFACNIKAGNSNLASQFVAYAIDCPPGLAFSEREDGWKGCDWPPEGGCDGLEEPQWAEEDEDEAEDDGEGAGGVEEAGDAGGVEEEGEVIMDVE